MQDQCNTSPGSYEVQRGFNLEITRGKLKSVNKLRI